MSEVRCAKHRSNLGGHFQTLMRRSGLVARNLHGGYRRRPSKTLPVLRHRRPLAAERFSAGSGLLFVVTGAGLSTIAWAYVEPNWALGILLVFAAIDMALYAVMRDVLVCYRCSARHRKANLHDDHPRFNLELNERYRQEEIRLAEAGKPS